MKKGNEILSIRLLNLQNKTSKTKSNFIPIVNKSVTSYIIQACSKQVVKVEIKNMFNGQGINNTIYIFYRIRNTQFIMGTVKESETCCPIIKI